MEQKDKLALFAFITALASAPLIIVPCCNLFALVGLPVAFILGLLGIKSENRKWMAILAMIISGIVIGIQVLGFILFY